MIFKMANNNDNISPQHWSKIEGLDRIIDALYSSDHPIRIVGGAVRDTLVGGHVHDIDLATPLLPDIVMQKLNDAGVKTIATGLQHGTITAISNSNSFEVTTLRKDTETDGRHAIVEFCDNWLEDAQRRDFTMNALYADPITGEIFDYFGGFEDLRNQRVKFIGHAHDRIEEDHLRILRYFRFLARFENVEIDVDSLEACAALSKRQMTLARERISDELIKICSVLNPYRAISTAYENGIFQSFLPEIQPHNIDNLKRLIQREQNYNIAPSALRRLAVLLPNDGKVLDKIASRLKFSNIMRKSLTSRAHKDILETDAIRKLAFLIGIDAALDIILIYGDANLEAMIDQLKNWDIPKFELKGGTLIERGLPAGPIVSETLQEIRQIWMDAGFPDQEALNALIDRVISEKLAD